MKLKRFCILSVLAAAAAAGVACISEPVYRYYIRYEKNDNVSFGERADRQLAEVWSQMLGCKVTAEDVSDIAGLDMDNPGWLEDNPIYKGVLKSGDRELKAYLATLSDFCRNSDLEFNSWNYPSKSDIARRDSCLSRTVRAAECYKGTRLTRQYALLRMKVALKRKDYAECGRLWKSADKSPSVFTDLMAGIYACALYREGRLDEAAEIYASIDDERSCSWCVAKWGDTDGIRKFYESDPNASVLPYLVKEFCDDYQETVDNLNDSVTASELKENLDLIGAREISRRQADSFITLAMEAASNPEVSDRMMWVSAASLIYYYQGNPGKASRILKQNAAVGSTPESDYNARLAGLFAEVCLTEDPAALRRLVCSPLAEFSSGKPEENAHGRRMLTRLVYTELLPRFRRMGDVNGMLTAMSVVFASDGSGDGRCFGESDVPRFAYAYSSDYYALLDSIPVEEIVKWREYVASADDDSDSWRKLAAKSCEGQQTFLADIIGCRLIRRGDFAEAEKWEAMVPASFFSAKPLSPYMAKRDFKRIPWLPGRPSVKEDEFWKVSIKKNPRLEFCRYVRALEQSLASADEKGKAEIMRRLAAAYAQASPKGECWWLSAYGWSGQNGYSVGDGDMDFIAEARRLLARNSQSPDASVSADAYFAMAFVSPDNMRVFNWNTDKWELDSNTQQYGDYTRLVSAIKGRTELPGYISRCDVLKSFMNK